MELKSMSTTQLISLRMNSYRLAFTKMHRGRESEVPKNELVLN